MSKRKKVLMFPAYAAIIALMGGRRKMADRFLMCLYDHGYYIGATKHYRPIQPPKKAA